VEDSARITAAVDRDALAGLLSSIPEGRLAAVAQDLFQFLALPARFPWSDSAAVVQHIDGLPARATDVPPLVAYAARLAHEVDELHSIEINRWIDIAGRSAGLSAADLRVLYQESRPPGGLDLPTDPDNSAYTGKSDILLTPSEEILTTHGAAVDRPRATLEQSEALRRIWGGVPIRNPDFTGRESLLLTLQQSLETRSKASVLPHALHGFGGVGKTQLAVEYAYRYADRYDLVWWIPAEQQPVVLQSLAELGVRLGIPGTEDFTQASALVLDALSSTSLNWLLVYDNANEPDDLAHLIPSAGGHVILTSRNQTWSNVWDALEVNVFDRAESVTLIQKRGSDISAADANRLAEKLGDLPLALDQAASWQSATGMPITEYLELFDQHVQELLSEGKPASYPLTIAALVKLAFQGLQRAEPAVAQLLEMFAVFGAEPVSIDLLRRGRHADIPAPLGAALRDPIKLRKVVRGLRKYGLAKVDPDNNIQVHRLFQLVLQNELTAERVHARRTDVHNLLGEANPGEPDDPRTHREHAQAGPHVLPAQLIQAESEEARRVVLDQIRYLWMIGDNEGSRRLGEAALDVWSKPSHQGDIGPDGELTLLATRHLANALLSLGINERATRLAQFAHEKFRNHPDYGPDHEHTIGSASTLTRALRVAGAFAQAHELDTEIWERSRRVLSDVDPLTLRVQGNVAVDLRMLSRFAEAHKNDSLVVEFWQKAVSMQDVRLLFAQCNLARDLYGLGRYTETLDLQRELLPVYRQVASDPKHPDILLAARTLAIAYRKTGHYDAALREAHAHYRESANRYGADHQHSLAATMTYANSLRVSGDFAQARSLAVDAVARYRRVFGEKHPLSLTASTNLAVILRSLGDLAEARRLDETTHSLMVSILGADHGYTLCAASNLANDLALAGEPDAALRLSAETLSTSRTSRGEHHPYTLLCAANTAFDRLATGDLEGGRGELATAVEALKEALGADHPEVLDVSRGVRAECDIEPPPS
jgi:tetratricopeptide (TPR) repeat protein